MWINVVDENIMGHDYKETDTCTIKIKDTVLIFNEENNPNFGKYKYKYVNNSLVEMTNEEVENHPIVIRESIIAKLKMLKEKEKERLAWKEVKKLTLTQVEMSYVDSFLAELEA